MDEKKECVKCRKANPLANKFCQFCGTKFEEERPGVWDEFMKSLPEKSEDDEREIKSKILMKAEGLNRKLLLMEDRILIRHKRDFWSTLAVGEKGDKVIPISNITSIQFKKAGFVNGYIQFTYPGCEEAKGGIFQSIQDENSVAFGAEHEEAFVKIKDVIERV